MITAYIEAFIDRSTKEQKAVIGVVVVRPADTAPDGMLLPCLVLDVNTFRGGQEIFDSLCLGLSRLSVERAIIEADPYMHDHLVHVLKSQLGSKFKCRTARVV
jgi:hypothetical protein